jgi:hypothetical protein
MHSYLKDKDEALVYVNVMIVMLYVNLYSIPLYKFTKNVCFISHTYLIRNIEGKVTILKMQIIMIILKVWDFIKNLHRLLFVINHIVVFAAISAHESLNVYIFCLMVHKPLPIYFLSAFSTRSLPKLQEIY